MKKDFDFFYYKIKPKPKSTPGLWQVKDCQRKDGTPFKRIERQIKSSDGTNPLIAILPDSSPTVAQWKANFLLIVAAPEMLETLYKIVDLTNVETLRFRELLKDIQSIAEMAINEAIKDGK